MNEDVLIALQGARESLGIMMGFLLEKDNPVKVKQFAHQTMQFLNEIEMIMQSVSRETEGDKNEKA